MVVSMKIKNKLVLAFVSVAFIPVSLVAVISVMNTRTQAVDQFIDGSTREIRQIDGNIRQFFDGPLALSGAIALTLTTALMPMEALADAGFQKWIRDFYPVAAKEGISLPGQEASEAPAANRTMGGSNPQSESQ